MAMGSTSTVEILVADKDDPILAIKEKLASESCVFRRLLYDLCLNQIELKDFDPSTVAQFLDALQLGENKSKESIRICCEVFREFHKLAAVFGVQWLVDTCLVWLKEEIKKVEIQTDYDEKCFLFEECRFILNRWKESEMMDLITWKMVRLNDHFFLSRYMTDVESKSIFQLDCLLMISVSNTQVVMEIIIREIRNKTTIGENVKYLLQNLNLALCCEQNNELYHKMFELLSNLPDLTLADQTFLFKIFRETTRQITRRAPSNNPQLHVFKLTEWRDWLNSCQTAGQIVELVKCGRVDSMFIVTILIVHVSRFNALSIVEAGFFMQALVDTAATKTRFKRVSHEFIDQVVTALNKAVRSSALQLIAVISLIKEKKELSSEIENVHIYGSAAKGSRFMAPDFSSKCILFHFRHPGLPNGRDCSRHGKCGFILDRMNGVGDSRGKKLCKDREDYAETGVHYHKIVAAEDMFFYKIWSCKLSNGSEVKVPLRWEWVSKRSGEMFWSWMLPNVIEMKSDGYCVAYNVRDYLVWNKRY